MTLKMIESLENRPDGQTLKAGTAELGEVKMNTCVTWRGAQLKASVLIEPVCLRTRVQGGAQVTR